jgi:spore coat-associated protein N
MAKAITPVRRVLGTTAGRAAIIGAAAVGGLALVSTSVFATLTAQAFNTSPTAVTAGRLSLIQADNGSGFTTAITKMAPGDTINRYVQYTNDGNLDGQNLRLSLADSAPSSLTNDGTVGLSVTVSQCSVAWNASTGGCSGTTTNLGTSTALALKTTPMALAVVPTTPAGANIVAGQQIHLKFAIALPAGSEVTTNGVEPAGTVQGKSASLTWTLTETLRDATTTNS